MSDDVVRLVDSSIRQGQPHSIRNQLIRETRKLLWEGISDEILKAALREWDNRPGANVSWLPHLVSDVIRQRRAAEAQDADMTEKKDWEKRLQKEMDG